MKAKIRSGQKEVKCMNHDPDNSKWGEYAPEGGCQETMFIDEASTRGLCWQCTQRSVNNVRGANTTHNQD